MKEKSCRTKLLPITIIFLLFFVAAIPCKAQEWSRRGRIELYGMVQNMSGDSTSASDLEVMSMKLDSTSVIGLGYGTNFSDHVNLNMNFWLGSTDVTGEAFSVTVQGDTSLLGLDFNRDINLLLRRLTPMITGGIGLINLSGNIEGFPVGETDLSYNYGGGLRWDATDHLLFKVTYRFTKTQLEETDKAVMLDGPVFSVGYVF